MKKKRKTTSRNQAQSQPQRLVDLRVIELNVGDFLGVVELEDEPGRAAIVAENEENGVSNRRVIEFPLDPLLLLRLAESLMLIADIQQISFPKPKKDADYVYADVQFGPKYAKEVYRRTC
ncbi:MAG: hypothetical protein AB7L09_01160 [Nitrospira sp.]